MRKIIIVFFILFFSFDSYSANLPVTSTIVNTEPVITPKPFLRDISTMRVKEVQKLLGRKLKLKEKIAFKVFQWKLRKGWLPVEKPAKGNKGKTAMIFGIISVASLFIPYVGIIALPAAILALVFGYDARKEDPSNRQARTALVLGWITIALFLIALVWVEYSFIHQEGLTAEAGSL